MKIEKSKLYTILVILLALMMLNVCSADDWSRKGKTEIFGTVQQMEGDKAEYHYPDTLPVVLDIDETRVYGIGLGYNLDNHWNINTDILFGSADTDVKIINTTVETQDMDYVMWDINLDYNILKGRFTPLVTGGIGLMDVGIDTTARTGEIHETDFSYNLGAGVRWDIQDNILLKLIYRSTWIEIDGSEDDQRLDGINFSFAYMF